MNKKNKYIEEINEREDLIDFLNIEITKFLVKTAPSINEKTVEDISIYFHLLHLYLLHSYQKYQINQ